MGAGKITKWSAERAYGWIRPDEGGPELFIHITALPRGVQHVAVGERVRYDVGKDQLGRLRATNAELIDDGV